MSTDTSGRFHRSSGRVASRSFVPSSSSSSSSLDVCLSGLMMETREAVASSHWPEVDSQPLTLGDPCRLRAAAARAYAVVKNRDVGGFDGVMRFLDATYALLPRLVPPIKHMKIMFGLKTLVIMRMLQAGRSAVDIVLRTIQFFPRKLPQYQDQCNQHEMFLMRKNHLDFKVLAQTLAIDKGKLEDYLKNQMDKRYGENYAQKLEDRLQHYLRELETLLPRETCIHQLQRNDRPDAAREETPLLGAITCDSTGVAANLRRLLHCDAASCCPNRVPLEAEREAEVEPAEGKSQTEPRPEVIDRAEERRPKDDALLLDDSEETTRQPAEEDGQICITVEAESSLGDNNEELKNAARTQELILSQRSGEPVQEAALSPQFCSKHRRWVRSILRECPDDQLLLQARESPLLFQSSSSTSSSQDLTPSDLIPRPPASQTDPRPRTPAQVSERESPKENLSSGSAISSHQTEPLVQVTETSSIREDHQPSPHHASPHCLHISGSSALPQTQTVASPNLTNATTSVQTSPSSQNPSISTSCLPPTTQSFSRLSRKFRRAARHSQPQTEFIRNPSSERFGKAATSSPDVSMRLPQDSPSETSHSIGAPNQISSFTKPPSNQTGQPIRPQVLCSAQPHPQTRGGGSLSRRPPAVSAASGSDCPSVGSAARLRLSPQSQAVLLQSKLLQPYVRLARLNRLDRRAVTEGPSSPGLHQFEEDGGNDESKEEDKDDSHSLTNSPSDLNALYSSYSSSSDGEDSEDSDPDYKPAVKKRRLLPQSVTVASNVYCV